SFIASPDNERSFEFEILVENQGEGAGSADVGFYLSTDRDISNTDTLVDFVTTGVIAPGESETVSGVVQWPLDLNGEYIYGLLVDDLGQVSESDESNNDTRFAPVFLGQNAQTCIDDFGEQDDVQTDAVFVLPPTDPFRRHCTDSDDWFEFDATAGSVYTFSTTRLGPASDTVIEIVDGNGNVLARSDNAIGRASSLAITAPRTEVLFVRATQFSGARGRERDYYLNIRQDDLRPDLLTWVDAPDVSLQAGSQVTFDMTVSNIGLGNAPASRIGLAAFASELGSLNRDAPAFFDLADLNIPPLNAGESVTLQTSVTIPDYSGEVIFTSAADGDGVIDEAVDSGDGPNYNQGNFLRRTIVGGSGKAVELKEKGPEQPPILESQP
ncbi:MAG: CARDB domain-containing protein, partial [Oceanococcaceae bacterium]